MSRNGAEPLLESDHDSQGKPSDTPAVVTAADRRAKAVYYSFTLVCIGLLVLLIVVLVESHKWRSTVSTESKAWRDLMQKFEDDLGKHFGAANNPEL